MKQAAVEWDLIVPTSVPAVEGPLPRFQSIIPTLEDFACRPRIVDEHLTAMVAQQHGLDRLTVKMSPHLGFMRCRIESDARPEESREWKIKARFDTEDLTTDLLHKTNEILARLSLDGAEELIERLDQGHFDAYAVPRHRNTAVWSDSSLSRGHIEVFDKSAYLEHSGATVSLQVGTQVAMIRINPSSDHYSQATNIVFSCSQKYLELNGFQLHYIETAYKLLSSHNSGDRHRGVQMCCTEAFNRSAYFDGHKIRAEKHPGIDSLQEMELDYWSPLLDLPALLGPAVVDEITSIPGIHILEPRSDSVENIRNKLDGGHTIIATRFGSETPPANAHWFRRITCVILNNGGLRVSLHNAMGGFYHTEIGSDKIDHETGSASKVESLVKSFAQPTGERWTDVLGEIERICGDSGGDLEVRYAGQGCATVSFLQDYRSPIVEFTLRNDTLCQVVIARPKFNSTKEDTPTTTLLRFSAGDIVIDSPSYREILDSAHDFAREMNRRSWDTGRWRDELPQMLEPFITALSAHMKRVV